MFLIDGARLHDEQALLRLETALYEQLKAAGSRRVTARSFRVRSGHAACAVADVFREIRVTPLQSSGESASSGNRMSVKPKREKSRTRIG